MADKYLLDGHIPVPCEDLFEWSRKLEQTDRRVAETYVGGIHVSTVFLGLDHQFGNGPPLLFETMVFGGILDQEQERCSTWDQAEVQHSIMVERVKGTLQ